MKKRKKIIEPEVYEVSPNMKLKKQNAVIENALIEARYSLTVEEQRLVLTTIAMLDNMETNSSGFPMLRIPKKLIIEATGLHEKDYKVIKNSLQRLMSRVITIETEKGFELYQWFAKAKYNKGDEYIEVQFHPDLKPYLLELKKRFTKIPLKQILQLRSKYAIRLYELLRRYTDTGFRTDYLLELREKLGVEKKEYTRFFDFERFVLKPAIKEINEKTDLEVSYKKKKTGRKITHIEFTIKQKDVLGKGDENLELGINQAMEISSQNSEVEEEKAIMANKNEKKFISVWEEIREVRKKYKSIIEEIKEKTVRLNENQILFLLVNAIEQDYPEELIKEIIITADKNKALSNPMGFLINTFHIDMANAKFKELTFTAKKIDEDMFKKKLEDMLVNGKSALEYIKAYWNDRVKGKVNKNTAVLLKEPLRKSVYDDFENKIYIPASDNIYKGWLEINFLEDIREYLKNKFGIDDVEVISFES